MSINNINPLYNNYANNDMSGDANRNNPIGFSHGVNYLNAPRAINSYLCVGQRNMDEDIFIKTNYVNNNVVINEIRYVKKGEYYDFNNIKYKTDPKRSNLILKDQGDLHNKIKNMHELCDDIYKNCFEKSNEDLKVKENNINPQNIENLNSSITDINTGNSNNNQNLPNNYNVKSASLNKDMTNFMENNNKNIINLNQDNHSNANNTQINLTGYDGVGNNSNQNKNYINSNKVNDNVDNTINENNNKQYNQNQANNDLNDSVNERDIEKEKLDSQNSVINQTEDNQNKNKDMEENSGNMENYIDWIMSKSDNNINNEINNEFKAQNIDGCENDKTNSKDVISEKNNFNITNNNNSNCENNIFGLKGPKINIIGNSPNNLNENIIHNSNKELSNKKIENNPKDSEINDNINNTSTKSKIMQIKISNINKKDKNTLNENKINNDIQNSNINNQKENSENTHLENKIIVINPDDKLNMNIDNSDTSSNNEEDVQLEGSEKLIINQNENKSNNILNSQKNNIEISSKKNSLNNEDNNTIEKDNVELNNINKNKISSENSPINILDKLEKNNNQELLNSKNVENGECKKVNSKGKKENYIKIPSYKSNSDEQSQDITPDKNNFKNNNNSIQYDLRNHKKDNISYSEIQSKNISETIESVNQSNDYMSVEFDKLKTNNNMVIDNVESKEDIINKENNIIFKNIKSYYENYSELKNSFKEEDFIQYFTSKNQMNMDNIFSNIFNYMTAVTDKKTYFCYKCNNANKVEYLYSYLKGNFSKSLKYFIVTKKKIVNDLYEYYILIVYKWGNQIPMNFVYSMEPILLNNTLDEILKHVLINSILVYGYSYKSQFNIRHIHNIMNKNNNIPLENINNNKEKNNNKLNENTSKLSNSEEKFNSKSQKIKDIIDLDNDKSSSNDKRSKKNYKRKIRFNRKPKNNIEFVLQKYIKEYESQNENIIISDDDTTERNSKIVSPIKCGNHSKENSVIIRKKLKRDNSLINKNEEPFFTSENKKKKLEENIKINEIVKKEKRDYSNFIEINSDNDNKEGNDEKSSIICESIERKESGKPILDKENSEISKTLCEESGLTKINKDESEHQGKVCQENNH